MTRVAELDEDWLAAHPLPRHGRDTTKNDRGRVVLAGGSEFVPGALRLTGEAVLRAGAGKLQMATVRAAAMSLGVLVPEAAMIALPSDDDGEIAAEAAGLLAERLERCDTLLLGPGMGIGDRTAQFVAKLLADPRDTLTVVLDAAAMTCARGLETVIARHEGRVVMTPHHGEMALLADIPAEDVARDPAAVAADMAARFNAIFVLKAATTLVAAPDGAVLRFANDCTGLATGGSGDVLAGILGGLLARGANPVTAAGWAVWLHGQAGRRLSEDVGELGFLARDLVERVPGLMR